MEKYDTSQLTEFPRFESESSQSSVSTFFNKFWKFPLFTPSEGAENGQGKGSGEVNQENARSEKQTEGYEDSKPETGTYAEELEGRSLPNVLRRISSLIAMGSGGGTRYADTELARYWMPDDISRECYECATRFSTLRRRHHCRVCGQIFCSRCCSQRVPGHIFGCNGGLRVCNYCCNVVLSYLKENDFTGEISPDLRTLQENLQVKFPDNKDRMSKGRDNFVFAHDQEERCDVRNSPKETLQDVFRELSYSLPTQQHRYRLVSYNGVWRGCDILQWIMDNTNNKTRAQANMICESLVSSGYMESVTELPHFADYALYRPLPVMQGDDDDDDDQREESPRLVESVSSYCLDLNLGEKSARLIKTPKPEKKTSSSEEEAPAIEQNEGIPGYVESKRVCPALSECGAEHLRLLLRQCLARAALPPHWLDTLLPLCEQAAEAVTPDGGSGDMDVRNYVQVKKVPGGSPRDSCLVNGVVLTKNVAHRGMPQQLSNPSVLLLDCSIAYQRVEGKLTSLEPVLMQESEYLSRCALRIAALRAGVVCVRGAAGGAVAAALRAAGAALAARVSPRALRRAARSLRADMLASIDARIGMPRLGTCERFYVKNFGSKTLMVFEGCAQPQLGCCILLRGASLQELIRVKKVVKFMLLACYNWKLEKAFFADIEAILPEPGMAFDDEINDNDDSNSNVVKIDEGANQINFDQHGSLQKDISNEMFTNDSPKSSENSDIFDTNRKSNSESISVENNDVTSAGKTDVISPENTDIAENLKFTNSEFTQTENTNVTTAENDNVTNNVNNTDSTDVTQSETDPLQRPKSYTRKTENLSCGVPIRDFSDPLRATLSVDDDVFLPREETTLKADAQNERWSADDVVLSMSPMVVIPAPYLETEAGRRCPFRACFPTPLLRAATPHTPRLHARTSSSTLHKPTQHQGEYHPFVSMAIRTSADDMTLKAALASYRAHGARVNHMKHKPSCPQYNPSVIRKPAKEPAAETDKQRDEPLDPFSPENHQQLHLLYYSFSNKSPNVPDFCDNPWIVVMHMYGRNDISLGAFLEKYCFNSNYKCTANSCNVPMNQHVRRFVHGDVCISITCNTIGHSSVDKNREEQSKQVMFWSRCEQCGSTERARRLSARALSLSLAQYVRWRASPAPAPRPRPRAAPCAHPLHRCVHAFQATLTTAYCKYSKISTYDIILPPDMITTNYDTKQMRDNLISQLNEIMLKGHEIFNNVGSGEADKEYQAFKHHMENIHVALTSPALQDPDTDAVVQSLWSISDGIISGEKLLREAQDKWAAPLNKNNKQQIDTPVEDKSDIDESSGEASGNENTGTTYVFSSDNSTKDSDKEHTGTEEDEEKGDKKTVRQILSQLLSNNQPANQGGMIVCSGVVPVVVQATQTGSVIACALASAAYRRARAHRHAPSTQTESEETDTNVGNKEKVDGDKAKPTKSNEHVEVLLKDGLVCRVYYAAQFQALRHAVIAPRGKDFECCCDNDKKLCNIEEGFIRSLAQCVPWAARGGKSGSTFCKTKDDRYVLKEMTKPEWQQFLEFAPHYFNYVTSCRQNKVPSLLARILGVYAVGGAGSGVLVMENVWYSARQDHTRFDLKGSSRHRLAAHAPNAVLMDENLLNLRWESPLYVRGDAWRALNASVRRDSAFLARHGVMDYSLLLATGDSTLVLGVIDYIRTFTWDKKLEHLVKKNLGSGQPTVVSPEQYMTRFCAALNKYFLQCPEHWDHLYTVLPSMHAQ